MPDTIAERADGQALLAERLETVTREMDALCFAVSHDLRAPLVLIDGFSRALLEDYHDRLDSQGRQYLERLRASSQKMAGMLDALLVLARLAKEELHREEVDLSSMAREICGELSRTDTGRTVTFCIEEGIRASGDRGLLRKAFEQLFGNAWKFTTTNATARIEFGATAGEGTTTLFVRDNGVGFDMNRAERLFVPFQRLHGNDEFAGQGVGLAIAKRIIVRHGGRIWARAQEGAGATFYISL